MENENNGNKNFTTQTSIGQLCGHLDGGFATLSFPTGKVTESLVVLKLISVRQKGIVMDQ